MLNTYLHIIDPPNFKKDFFVNDKQRIKCTLVKQCNLKIYSVGHYHKKLVYFLMFTYKEVNKGKKKSLVYCITRINTKKNYIRYLHLIENIKTNMSTVKLE